jgi:hypothetical protein
VSRFTELVMLRLPEGSREAIAEIARREGAKSAEIYRQAIWAKLKEYGVAPIEAAE